MLAVIPCDFPQLRQQYAEILPLSKSHHSHLRSSFDAIITYRAETASTSNLKDIPRFSRGSTSKTPREKRKSDTIYHPPPKSCNFFFCVCVCVCVCVCFYARSRNCEKWQTAQLCLFICLYVRPSVRMEQLGSHWSDFHEISYFRILRKCRENLRFIKIWQKWRLLFTKTDTHFSSHLAHFF
jgi:hypothetical protein